MTSPAIIWSAALQSAATLLAGSAGGARWGIDQPGDDAAWPGSAGPVAGTAARVVELAVHIVMDMPDDARAGISQAKQAARRWLDSHGS
jgi:hypothetical protein